MVTFQGPITGGQED